MELHHLWNPDWTYAMPQQQQQPPPIYDYDSYANYDNYPNQQEKIYSTGLGLRGWPDSQGGGQLYNPAYLTRY